MRRFIQVFGSCVETPSFGTGDASSVEGAASAAVSALSAVLAATDPEAAGPRGRVIPAAMAVAHQPHLRQVVCEA